MNPVEGLDSVLAEHPFFSDMSDHARGLIVGCAGNRVFHDGDFILRDGDEANEFYLIRHGTVALEIHLPGRAPLVVETLGNGEVLGWSWLLPPYRVSFDARAVGLVRALGIKGSCLRKKCDEDCALGYEFYKHFLPVVASRLTATRLQLLDMYRHPDAYAQAAAKARPEAVDPAKPSPEGP